MSEVLIAEDDIHFSAVGAFNFFLQHKPVAYDLYLGGILWRSNADHEDLVNFCGLTLYIVHERFYETFLGLRGEDDIDRELADRGVYKLCQPMVATQHNGYSDNRKIPLNFDRYKRAFTYYGG